MYGFGLPSGDMFMFKGIVTFGKIRKWWIFLVWGIERGWNTDGARSADMLQKNAAMRFDLKMIGWIYLKKRDIMKKKKLRNLETSIYTWRKQ